MDLICEERPSDSPFVETIWRSRSEQAGPFISIAESQYSLVVTKYRGRAFMTVRGPSTHAAPAFTPADAEFLGIQFKPGVFLQHLPPALVAQRNDISLPEASSDSFWLQQAAWQYPDFENVDSFVDRLARGGMLVADPLVTQVLHREPVDATVRTLRRHFLYAAGMPYGSLFQIERARYATLLLKQGAPIQDAVYRAGYFDQPHLTRSLKQYIGLTPAQISDETSRQPLSFLYKTTPLNRTMMQISG